MKLHQPLSKDPADILRHYLADIIYGANDGIITTFTVVSGVKGANLVPLIVIILGFVNLFADGISMGASRYLSIRASASVHGLDRGYLEPAYHGIFTFSSFVIFGLIPLFSYLIPNVTDYRFSISCILTAIALFCVGSLRYFITKKHWLRGGIEMLSIGGIVAIIAYSVGLIITKIL